MAMNHLGVAVRVRACSCMLLRTVGVLVTLGGIHLHVHYLSAITLVDFAFVLHVLTDLTLSFVYFTILSFNFVLLCCGAQLIPTYRRN